MMTSNRIVYRHPEVGFEIHLPADSEVVEDIPSVAVVALEPPSGRSFRANLVVTVEQVLPGTDVESYTDQSLKVQEPALQAFRLIDRAAARFTSTVGTRTLAHHGAEGVAVALEQWRLIAGEWGYTVSASVSALDYDEVHATFEECALTLQPGLGEES